MRLLGKLGVAVRVDAATVAAAGAWAEAIAHQSPAQQKPDGRSVRVLHAHKAAEQLPPQLSFERPPGLGICPALANCCELRFHLARTGHAC